MHKWNFVMYGDDDYAVDGVTVITLAFSDEFCGFLDLCSLFEYCLGFL